MLPVSGLPARNALGGRLDAVHDRVAQHVFEGRQHALEHLPVEFARSALDDQLGLLAGLGGGLAQQAAQPLHVALERHHARAHEPVLHFGDDAALLLQQVLRVAVEVFEQAFDAADVADRLGERARKLLDRRIAVEFQRIEIRAVRVVLLVLEQDLRLGFHLELAQLLAQTRHRAIEFGEVELHLRHLLLDARAENADFAGIVQQVVEEFRVHARQFLALGRRDGLAARQDRWRGRGSRFRGAYTGDSTGYGTKAGNSSYSRAPKSRGSAASSSRAAAR